MTGRKAQAPARVCGGMRIACEALAKGVTPADAYRWWTDFQEGHEDHAFFRQPPGAGRRILRRTPMEVEMEDSARVLWVPFLERTLAQLAPPDAVHLRGRNNLGEFRGTYTFHAHPEGTRVRFEGEVYPLGVLAFLSPLGKPFVAAFIRKDLRLHVREMVAEARPLNT